MSPINYNFRNHNGTDKSITVHLKCPSYCPFYMHIISIIVFYNICYIPIFLFINNAYFYLWHEFHNEDYHKRRHRSHRNYRSRYYIAYTTHRVYIHQCPIQIVKDLNFTVMIKGRAVHLSYVDRRSYIYYRYGQIHQNATSL